MLITAFLFAISAQAATTMPGDPELVAAEKCYKEVGGNLLVTAGGGPTAIVIPGVRYGNLGFYVFTDAASSFYSVGKPDSEDAKYKYYTFEVNVAGKNPFQLTYMLPQPGSPAPVAIESAELEGDSPKSKIRRVPADQSLDGQARQGLTDIVLHKMKMFFKDNSKSVAGGLPDPKLTSALIVCSRSPSSDVKGYATRLLDRLRHRDDPKGTDIEPTRSTGSDEEQSANPDPEMD